MYNEWQLTKYRNGGMSTYTYFWINSNNIVVSPYFDSSEEAFEWLKNEKLKRLHNSI